MNRRPRLMVVSQTFAPLVAGSPILLANLLNSYPSDVLAVAGHSHYLRREPTFAPPCKTVYLRPPRIGLLERSYDRAIGHLSGLVRAFIRHHVNRWQPDVIMGAFPVVDFFVPGFQVAQELGIPFYAHMHDLWRENNLPDSHRGVLADRWEEIILRQARRVLCMTESQQEHYRKRYAIPCDLLPHTVTPESLEAAPRGMAKPTLPRRTVLFVGNFSRAMNADALAVLAMASERLARDVELVFCTGSSIGELADLGITSSRLRAMWVSQSEVRRLQSAAHVLVAPLSCKNGSADEVKTVFSTKILEYLVSGRPIVVFAPPDSFQARSAREGGWGLTVDKDSPEALADAVMRVMEDDDLATGLVAGALEEARRRDARFHAQRLYEWVAEDGGNHQDH
jgi:glycosyltransferase involved in cell wall biosynthesis